MILKAHGLWLYLCIYTHTHALRSLCADTGTQFLKRNRSKKEMYKRILQRLVIGCNQPFNYGHWRYRDGQAKVKGFMRAIETSWETWLPRVLHTLWFIPFLLPLPQSLPSQSLGQRNSMWSWEEDLVGRRSGGGAQEWIWTEYVVYMSELKPSDLKTIPHGAPPSYPRGWDL